MIPKELGLKEKWVYETIVTTKNSVAPIGIWTEDGKTVSLEIYKTARSCQEIISGKEFVINFPFRIEDFYNTEWERKGIEYGKTDSLHLPYMDDCNGYLEARIQEVEDLEDRVRIIARIVNFKILNKVRLINRAESLLLEILIKASKIAKFQGEKRDFLLKEIQECMRVIKKVAPGSKYERIAEKVIQKL